MRAHHCSGCSPASRASATPGRCAPAVIRQRIISASASTTPACPNALCILWRLAAWHRIRVKALDHPTPVPLLNNNPKNRAAVLETGISGIRPGYHIARTSDVRRPDLPRSSLIFDQRAKPGESGKEQVQFIWLIAIAQFRRRALKKLFFAPVCRNSEHGAIDESRAFRMKRICFIKGNAHANNSGQRQNAKYRGASAQPYFLSLTQPMVVVLFGLRVLLG